MTRGASTITQQLAKNLFLTPDQTLQRKVQEALLAIWLEQNYSKDDILELYLNRVFFGHNATGIEAAAQTYFGKSARNLSLSEAAMLAGSVQAPSRLNPQGDPAAVKARQLLVLQAMAKEGYISEAEAKAAQIDPNQTIRTKVTGAESYVADWVESLMTAYIGDINEGRRRLHHHRLGPAEGRRVRGQGGRRQQGRGTRLHPGRAGGHGCRRHRAGAGRRRRLRAEPVQPRRHGAPPARLGLQALRLSGRHGKGLYARHRRRRRPLRLQRLGARRMPPASTWGR